MSSARVQAGVDDPLKQWVMGSFNVGTMCPIPINQDMPAWGGKAEMFFIESKPKSLFDSDLPAGEHTCVLDVHRLVALFIN